MIIEKIPHGAIPYRCEHCESIYLWAPSDTNGKCDIGSGLHECERSDCHFYKLELEEIRCPFCGDRYDQERISSFKYKIARALRGGKQNG